MIYDPVVRINRLLHSARLLLSVSLMSIVVGSLCALFLWALDEATRTRFDNPWLLFALPFAGVAVGFLYHWTGRSAEGGNNLIVDQIHEPGGGVPLRMAPLIFLSTVLTHLFGGSAGREGTAVQLGGSIASGFARAFRLMPADTRILLMAGIAAGFGAVFGTPVTGAIFALEVLAIGRIQYDALIPCLVAAVVGDWVCQSWGAAHTHYHISFMNNASAITARFHLDPVLLAKVIIAGIAFGLIGRLFSESSHLVGAFFKKLCPYGPLRPFIGGVLVILLVYIFGTREYLGLGVWSPNPGDVTISSFFNGDDIHPWSWLIKLVFTIVTLSTGFKGGEVTPLFFIGAALGHALSALMGAPTDLFAALGFVAIFAGASNTPLACTIMGVELFGSTHTVYIAIVCFIAYVMSGHSGIYLSQRIGVPKNTLGLVPPDVALRHVREFEPSRLDRLMDHVDRKKSKSLTPIINPKESIATMPYPHKVTPKETGMLRIYLKPGERIKVADAKIFNHRPLYRALVTSAKQAGIVNAVAHHTHYGYSNHGSLEERGVELQNPHLTMCVELIGERDKLELFCRQHGEHLRNKVIVYKHLEHWHIHHGADIVTSDMVEEHKPLAETG